MTPRGDGARSTRPVVLVHGYSDSHEGFRKWRDILKDEMRPPVFDVRVASYESLTNEISIKDIAEAFDRALRRQAGLEEGQEFDVIVHSTGMLVLRAWLATYAERRNRLKHLVAFAPATWGSPLAHKGRSWLGSVFKGSKNPFKPDFLEAGNEVLQGLELGSRFTWDLAEKDLFGETPFYGPGSDTPYVFVFCGNRKYSGIRELASEPGTDGTIRWAGCSLNSRKITIDLTERVGDGVRAAFQPWTGVSDIPVVMVDGLSHATIMQSPTDALVDLVQTALDVDEAASLEEWNRRAVAVSAGDSAPVKWQQFVVRMVDERGDPVTDYNIRLFEDAKELREFTGDVHTYERDRSLRNFHVDVTKLIGRRFRNLRIQVVASTGTQLVGYVGYSAGTGSGPEPTLMMDLDITNVANGDTTLFYPLTTTAIEIRINREPMPLGQESRLCRIVE